MTSQDCPTPEKQKETQCSHVCKSNAENPWKSNSKHLQPAHHSHNFQPLHHCTSSTFLSTMKFTIIALAGALASANARQLRTTTVRKLEGAQRAELDGSAIISFAKCIEVSVQSDDADEDTQTAVLAGTAKPVKSFAAFYTNTYANDNEMMMVGLGDYVAAKVKSSAMKAQQACETCRQFEETCNPEEEEVEVSQYFSICFFKHTDLSI